MAAWGRLRPAITSSSRALSKMALSLPPSTRTGLIFWISVAEERRLQVRLPRPHVVDVAPQRVDLAVVAQHPQRLGQAPRGKRVRAVPLVDDRKRRGEGRVVQVRVEGHQLRAAQHPLVDEGAAGEAGDVEAAGVGVGPGGDFLLGPPPDDVKAALQVAAARLAAAQEDLPDERLGRAGQFAQVRAGCRNIAPPEDLGPFLARGRPRGRRRTGPRGPARPAGRSCRRRRPRPPAAAG